MRRFLPLLFLVLIPAFAAAFSYSGWQKGPWTPLERVDGIQIWKNSESPTGIDAIRGDVVVDAPPSAVFPLIMSHDRARNMSSVAAYEVLEDDGDTLRIYQQIQRFGLGKRELTVIARVTRPSTPDAGVYAFVYEMDPRGKDDPDVKSVAYVAGSYVLTPGDGGRRTRASYRALLDPGTWIPDFVLQNAMRDNTVEVLKTLRRDVERRD